MTTDKESGFFRRTQALLFCFALILAFGSATQAQELINDTLRLKLNVTPEGIPVIEKAVWQATGQTVFHDLGTPGGLSAWVPEALIPAALTKIPVWTITNRGDLRTAEATRELSDKIFITWIVELPKQGQLFRLHVRLANRGNRALAVEQFPAWSASWDVAGQSDQSGQSYGARWWRSLEYDRVEQSITAAKHITLGSRRYSSDDAGGGVNPYWVVGGSNSRIYFGLQWCGGWSATLQSVDKGFRFSVGLPARETQLVLGRGETIDGPALFVTPMPGRDDADDRAVWMRQRHALGQVLYSGPRASFPLTYNHWYAARQRVDAGFLNRQIAAMPPYKFDAFIIDAGWFAGGRWKPDPAKFRPGEFVKMLASLKANGVKPGLWSTPQYASTINNDSSLTIEAPPVRSRFLGGYLVDMSQDKFANYLAEHVKMLRTMYSVDYWKYDQPLFTEQSRAGEMKNVIGFQKGLRAVRRANPDLVIENCLNGGRMINEFTLLATQTTWLSDLGNSGIPDWRRNITVALNAMDFIFPWAALRFTINLDRIDQNEDELLRFYCRSAMAGMWGISTDLSKLSERQQKLIMKEVENYRRLNRLKFACLYDLQLPNDPAGVKGVSFYSSMILKGIENYRRSNNLTSGYLYDLLRPDDTGDVAGVTFYGKNQFHAGVLLYRWQQNGAFDQRVALPKLKPWARYHVVDVDSGTEIIASGSDLISNGVTIPFSSERLSALLFVEPVTESQTTSAP